MVPWCTFLWTNSLSAIQAAAPEGMELGITTWPSDDAKKSNYLKPGQFFCVSSDSKDPVEAAKVIDFFTNSVDANKILLAERGVPASTVVADAIAPDLDAGTQSGMTFIKNVIAPNCSQINAAPPEGTSEAINLLKQLEEQLCYGQITAQEASEQFFTQGNAFLAAKAG